MSKELKSIHANLLLEAKDDVFKKYEVVEALGIGSVGCVSKVRVKRAKVGGSAIRPKMNGPVRRLQGLFGKKTTNFLEGNGTTPVYALKTIRLNRISCGGLKVLKNEIAVMRTLDHPNIVKATETYTYRNQIYIVMEACEGGSLHTRSPYSERQAATYMTQILSAINYMHGRNIVHRDLKYENVLFETTAPNSQVKVIDFGLSKKILKDEPRVMTQLVGTIYTMSPQVLQEVYTSQADLWSAGVIAYMLLSSSKPFWHKSLAKMLDSITCGAYNFSAPVWDGISQEGKDFVSSLLVVDPDERFNAKEALEHKWIVNREQQPAPTEDVLLNIPEGLLEYTVASDLKKIALNVIAHRSTSDEIFLLRQAFESYDPERNGFVTFRGFKAALAKEHYPEEELREIFESINVDKNGQISYTEFLAATLESHGHIVERRIAEAFDRIDNDNSGYISKKNLAEFFGKGYSKEALDAIVADADMDCDGQISYPEFLALFVNKRTPHCQSNCQALILPAVPIDFESDDD